MAAQQIEVGHNWAAEQWDWPLQHSDGVVKVIHTKEKFEVALDCPFFTPKEINIRVIGKDVVIGCVHEERTDSHGKIRREVHRCYHLPDDVDVATIKSHLNPKGILVVSGNIKK